MISTEMQKLIEEGRDPGGRGPTSLGQVYGRY